jgi:tetratricopeptide (TPR) repeat protein
MLFIGNILDLFYYFLVCLLLFFLTINTSDALAHQKKSEEAIKYCRQGIELNPKDQNLHRILGDILLKKSDIDKALASYQQAIQIDSQQMNYIFPLISALIKEKTAADVNNREPQTAI